MPSPAKLAAHLGLRTPGHGPRQGDHWSDFASRWNLSKAKRFRNLSLAEFCQQYEIVELWFDTHPEAQLQLIWLLDYFRAHQTIVSKMNLVQADVPIGDLSAEDLAASPMPAVKIRNGHLETARSAWKAYREPTPRAWFDLLSTDLSALPRLRPAVMMLLG